MLLRSQVLDIKVNQFLRYTIFSLLIVLLLFGVSFSKFSLGGALYVNDLLLILITGIAFVSNPESKIPFFFFLFSVISVTYFIVSLLLNTKIPVVYVFRQFMICGYFMEALIIFTSLFQQKERFDQLLSFIKRFAKASVIIDTIYSLFLYATGTSLFGDHVYVYISPLAVLGVMVYYALVLNSKERFRIFKLVWALCLLVLTGHASAVLGVVVMTMLYIGTYMRPTLKILASSLGLIAIPASLLLFRSLSDANAIWRLVYWGVTAKKIFIEKLGIIGHGFGVRYADEELSRILEEVYKFSATLKRDEDAFITPLHNAFLTFAFHVGFILTLVILIPIILAFMRGQSYRGNKIIITSDERFLAHALAGLSIWVGFNVILELPHSSLFFWLIFFLFYMYRRFYPPASKAV